jgi:hypothetical protein
MNCSDTGVRFVIKLRENEAVDSSLSRSGVAWRREGFWQVVAGLFRTDICTVIECLVCVTQHSMERGREYRGPGRLRIGNFPLGGATRSPFQPQDHCGVAYKFG